MGMKKRGDSYNYDTECSWRTDMYDVSNNTHTYGAWSTLPDSVDNGYFRGYNLESFHSLLRKGKIIPHTPWRAFRCKGSSSGDYQINYPNGDTLTIEGENFPCFSDWIITEEELVENAPDASAYADIAASSIYENSFDALTFIAELGDMKSLYFSLVKTLKSCIKRYSDLKDLSSTYLSYRYGWRPLISEITELNNIISNWNQEKRTRYRQNSGGSTVSTVETSERTSWKYVHIDRLVSSTYTASMRGSVVADIKLPTFAFNPVMTAWELVPLSFVFDWVVNVGQVIGTATFLCLVDDYSASYGYKISCDRTFSTENTQRDNDPTAYLTQTGFCQASLSVRTPTNVSISPHLIPNFDAFKILDLAALLNQRM